MLYPSEINNQLGAALERSRFLGQAGLNEQYGSSRGSQFSLGIAVRRPYQPFRPHSKVRSFKKGERRKGR